MVCSLQVRRRFLPRMQVDAHAQDFVASDELLLHMLKVFVPRPLNVKAPIYFHVF